MSTATTHLRPTLLQIPPQVPAKNPTLIIDPTSPRSMKLGHHDMKARPLSPLLTTLPYPLSPLSPSTPSVFLTSQNSRKRNTAKDSETLRALDTELRDVCRYANLLAARVVWGWLGRVVVIKQSFDQKKDEIAYFCTIHADVESPVTGSSLSSGATTSPLSPHSPKSAVSATTFATNATSATTASTRSDRSISSIVELLDRSIYDLHVSLIKLCEGLKRANDSALLTTKRRRLKKMVEECWRQWSSVMIHLTLAMSTSSNYLAENASNNFQKLAIATGNPDWESLDTSGATALLNSGDKYFMGHGVAKNYETALKRYLAAKELIPEACNMAGVMYENGFGASQDIGAAIKFYNEAGEKGSADAWNNLGRVYENGVGVEVDLKLSADYYYKAADGGCLDGMVNYGLTLENGVVGKTDAIGAKWWYEKAAQVNFSRALNCLGSLYYHGKSIAKDHGCAVNYFKKAVDQGNVNAMNNLGICYESGLGVPRDYVLAKGLYNKASEMGHPSATNNLGWIQLLEKNYMQAFRLFFLAANQGSIDSLHNIATMYEHGCADAEGLVVRRDEEIAVRFWKEAAEKGHAKSQFKLALTLLQPSVEFTHLKSPNEAFSWLEESAMSGNPDAAFHLGQCYEKGLGCGIDIRSARKWYARASESGHAKALWRTGLLFELGCGVGRDLVRAVRLYAEADRRGCKEARAHLRDLRDAVSDESN